MLVSPCEASRGSLQRPPKWSAKRGRGDATHPERNAPTGLLAGSAAATWFESLAEVWKPRATKPARRARLAVSVLGVMLSVGFGIWEFPGRFGGTGENWDGPWWKKEGGKGEGNKRGLKNMCQSVYMQALFYQIFEQTTRVDTHAHTQTHSPAGWFDARIRMCRRISSVEFR